MLEAYRNTTMFPLSWMMSFGVAVIQEGFLVHWIPQISTIHTDDPLSSLAGPSSIRMTQVLSTPSWLFSELIGVANISTASVVGIRAHLELEP